ncbi:helix-turn-helix transcriptional regulator [Massilia solisilvae]|uniref:Helix-turn-helix transcriptional regulator n=1 Tax=Massilia solisilvae TaxID=1811225 RepID=A0ABT2BFV2_9BURK|nr:helix-turn-helix transcriptional regulator [Massilia solisilvae]MCS0607393.1 helix-turn-helix transcriptional regulator [Massilia solisilvae]
MKIQHTDPKQAAGETVDMAALWADSMQDEDFQFDLKAQSVAIDLAQAAAEMGISQKELAERMKWSTARVSKVLHGSTNLTLRTLVQLAAALNLDFDIIYRNQKDCRAPQPWETKHMLDRAVVVCKKVDELRRDAERNLFQSQKILEAANQLNRQMWVKARAPVLASDSQITTYKMAA